MSSDSCLEKEKLSKKQDYFNIPENGQWSKPIQGKLLQNVKTRFYYFTVAKCDINERFKIRIEAKLLNSDGTQFSAEENGMLYAYPLILAVFFVFLSKNL